MTLYFFWTPSLVHTPTFDVYEKGGKNIIVFAGINQFYPYSGFHDYDAIGQLPDAFF